MRTRVGLVLLALLVLMSLPALAPDARASSPDILVLEQTDERERNSEGWSTLVENPVFEQHQTTPSQIDLRTTIADDHFQLWFYLPSGILGPGDYPDAVYPNSTGTAPGMTVTYGCHGLTVTGSFTIHELVWDGAAISTLALSFTCQSDDQPRFAGEIRINSDVPVAAHSLEPRTVSFARQAAGTTSDPASVTLTSLGSKSIAVGQPRLEGVDAGDFLIDADHCTGAWLESGESCEVTVRFAPSAGDALERTALLVVPDSTRMGYLRTELRGAALLPTVTTITALDNPSLSGSAPRFHGTVEPPANKGWVEWLVDGEVWAKSYVIDGQTDIDLSKLLGAQEVSARFLGTPGYQPSTSNVISQVRYLPTWVRIEVVPEPQRPGAVRLAAYITTDASRGFGGVLRLWDETTGVELASAVTSFPEGPTYVATAPVVLPGTHVLRASYAGVAPWVLPSETMLILEGPADVTAPEVSGVSARILKYPERAAVVTETGNRLLDVLVTLLATDDGPLGSWDVETSTDGRGWTRVASAVTSTSTISVAMGHATALRVRVRDAAGNLSPWFAGPVLAPGVRTDELRAPGARTGG